MKTSGWVAATSKAARALDSVSIFFSFLALPLALLLFVQWPLRELLQAYSRQANDAAQMLFALYMAVAITAASRGHAHLASHRPEHHGASRPRWQTWALLVCTAPWALFMLWAGWPVVAASVASLERFGETLTPGYFLIKLSMVLMLLLVLVDGVVQLMPQRPAAGSP